MPVRGQSIEIAGGVETRTRRACTGHVQVTFRDALYALANEWCRKRADVVALGNDAALCISLSDDDIDFECLRRSSGGQTCAIDHHSSTIKRTLQSIRVVYRCRANIDSEICELGQLRRIAPHGDEFNLAAHEFFDNETAGMPGCAKNGDGFSFGAHRADPIKSLNFLAYIPPRGQ